MPKTKIYQAYELPRTVVDLVRAVCADYPRRVQYIKKLEKKECEDICELDTLHMCQKLNKIVDEALEPIEETLRGILLEDICEKRGYEHSPAANIISKNAYYMRKRKFLFDIAFRLSLIIAYYESGCHRKIREERC